MHFSTPEEMEAYKRKIAEERKQQLFEVDLQLFNAEVQEAQPERPKQATIKPAIKPTDSIERKKDFSTIRQGTSTNALTKLRATEGKGLTIDQITGDATIKNGNFILTIPKYEQLTGLKTSTYQLLDAITVALTESGAKSPTVILPLEEYMKRRGLKDRKEA